MCHKSGQMVLFLIKQRLQVQHKELLIVWQLLESWKGVDVEQQQVWPAFAGSLCKHASGTTEYVTNDNMLLAVKLTQVKATKVMDSSARSLDFGNVIEPFQGSGWF